MRLKATLLRAWRHADEIVGAAFVALCLILIFAPRPAGAQVTALRDQQGHPYSALLGFDSGTGLSCVVGSTPTCSLQMSGGGGGGGGGGAVTGAVGSFVDGWSITLGAQSDSACATDNGACSEIALLKRENQRLSTIISTMATPTGVLGTDNATVAAKTNPLDIEINGAVPLPTGAATAANQATANTSLSTINTTLGTPFQAGGSIGNTSFIANAGTNLNTSALALDTSVNGLLLSQGSTTSGQKGPLSQCAVLTAAPTYTTAQTDPLVCTLKGGLTVTLVSGSAGTQLATASPGDAQSNSTTNLLISTEPAVFNGISWDRARSIAGSFGSATGVAATEAAGSSYVHANSNASVNAAKSGAGILHRLCINTKGASANTLTLYDSLTAGSGTTMAVIDTTSGPACFAYDLGFATGLSFTMATGTAADATITFR